jgi:hypothetical protein
MTDPFGLGAMGFGGFSWINYTANDRAHDEFMAGYNQMQAQMAMAWNTPATLSAGQAFSSLMNMTPLLGGFKMTGEAFFGSDFVTGQRIDNQYSHAAWGVANLGTTLLGVAEAGAQSSAPTVAAGTRPVAYSVAFETQLAPAQFALSSKRQMQLANNALSLERSANTTLADFVPAPTEWGEAPEGWTWHHATFEQANRRFGVMQLVPAEQHTSGSAWWPLLHPGNFGGYWQWAVPSGAPPR